MLSENLQELLPMAIAALLACLFVFLADVTIAVRWLVYRLHLQEAQTGLVTSGGEVAMSGLPRPPFASKWSLVHPFLAFQVVQLCANSVFMVVYLVGGGSFLQTAGHQTIDPMGTGPGRVAAIALLFAQNLLFVGAVAYLTRLYHSGLANIGLTKPTVRQIVLGLGLGVLLFLFSGYVLEPLITFVLQHLISPAGVAQLKRWSEPFDVGILFQKMGSPVLQVGLLLAGAVAAPIGEEVFFRGLVYNALKTRWGVATGVVVSGLLFAVVHFNPLAIMVIFPMGMLLALVYERTRSLWVTIMMHLVNNGLAFVLLLWQSSQHGH